jgi:uncharacterized heparinase superfamily protein
VTPAELGLLARTVMHLKPSQAAQRARLRAQRVALRRWPPAGRWLLAGPDPASGAGWPAGFSPLDAGIRPDWRAAAVMLRTGRIDLLGMTRTLAPLASREGVRCEPTDWARADCATQTDWARADCATQTDWARADWVQGGAPQLWRFHLHYWDWAWGLAAERDRGDARALFGTLWRSWRGEVAAGEGDPWLPYPAALRAWSFCGLHRDLVAGSKIDGCFIADLAAHAGFLRRNLESDVGGNHLIKNLKALIGLAVFFTDDRRLEQALNRLIGQLAVQILPDGGHYERAPAYHCQVLADLIDVTGLVRAYGWTPEPVLTVAIRRMRRWLGGVLSPGGGLPMLNDGYPIRAEVLDALRPGPPPAGPLLLLPDTGLVRATAGGWHLLADVGPVGPDGLPAHAHADTFGCLVHVDGAPLLVDTGTSTYAAGSRRGYERSTAAHNTVEVDGANSTEVWGAFRAAGRARVRDVVASVDTGIVNVAATHDGYRRRPGRPRHRRLWSLTDAGLRVDDLITGRGRHAIVIRWHLAPGSAVRLTGHSATVTTPAGEFRVSISAAGRTMLAAESSPVATGFFRTMDAPVLSCGIDAVLPVRVSTGWRRAGNVQAAAGITAGVHTDATSAGPATTGPPTTGPPTTGPPTTGPAPVKPAVTVRGSG